METAVARGDVRALANVVDWDDVLKLALRDLELSAKSRSEFRRGVLSSLQQPSGILGVIIQNVSQGGSYRLLRIGERDGQKSILMRMAGTSGVNYHEYLLTNIGGQPQATDIYIYLSAERISDTLRRAAIPLVQHESRNLVDRLTKTESAFVANVETIQKMTEAMQNARHAEAIDLYRQLPAELQRDKNIMLIRYQSAVTLGEAETTATLDDFRAHHPHDVGVDFMLIDFYVLKRDFASALECIDRLDQAVGGDPYLDSMRAEIVLQQGHPAEALRLAERAVTAVADLPGPRFSLIGASLATKDFGRTAAEMREVEQRFGLDFGELNANPAYAEFVKSPEGVAWQRRHRR
jgi:hypothetical protein